MFQINYIISVGTF